MHPNVIFMVINLSLTGGNDGGHSVEELKQRKRVAAEKEGIKCSFRCNLPQNGITRQSVI